MIKRKIFYIAKCDGCGKEPDYDFGMPVFEEKDDLIAFLKDELWEKRGKKWYCSYCREKEWEDSIT